MNKRSVVLSTCLVALLLSGCGLPFGLGAVPYQGVIVTANPLAEPSATAFVPLPPTATPPPTEAATATPTATATPEYPWGSFAAPVEPSAIDIPRPAPEIEFPASVVNIILLGSDQRPNEGGHRTDTMMVVSLNPSAGTATLFSIPRDLYVYIPGWRVDRINVADVEGGPEMVAQTILYNFGIRIDYWARVNFYGFVTAIDTLGGIEVQITGFLNDNCNHTEYTYYAGTTRYMDGTTALCYVRNRLVTGDIDRLRRQQEVIRAIFDRVVSLDGLSRLPDLYAQFSNIVETNMGLENMLPLVPLATTVAGDPSAVHQYAIDASMASLWRVPYSGASVLLPDWDAIHALLRTAFG
jgi:LCP family protein required for cell wall assembly